jgi:antibiotic biosynthesis monooxygenase (ABM) superfamily enzyme
MDDNLGGVDSVSTTRPVTVVISRIVAPGRERDYQHWMIRVLRAAAGFPNNLGAVILTPGAVEPNVHHLVHRFADEASLRAWESSETRRELSREADTFSTSRRQQRVGMEAWFQVPEAGLPSPPKWKMAIAASVVIYALTSVVIPLQSRLLAAWPFALRNFVTAVLVVSLMTYVAMPVVGRLLRNWLYRVRATPTGDHGVAADELFHRPAQSRDEPTPGGRL